MNFNKHITKQVLNEYAGSEKKMTVFLDDGCKYLLKFPDPTRDVKNDISYINNAISEYIGCKIMKEIGLPVQEVLLGEYTDKNGKTKVACACKDLRSPGVTMHEINKITLSDVDSAEAKGVRFEDINRFAAEFGLIPEDEIKEFYYDMFLVDAFIGNTDRHNGNWAVLTDSDGNASLSPVYDCGSSLSPLIGDNMLVYHIMTNEALNVYSAIHDELGKKISYRDCLINGKNIDVVNAVKRIVPRINMNNISKIIADTPYISDKRKEFYQGILSIRYEKILLPALGNILEKEFDKVIFQEFSTNKAVEDYSELHKLLNEFSEIPLFETKRCIIEGKNMECRRISGKKILLYTEDGKLQLISLKRDCNELKLNAYKINCLVKD